MTSPPYIGRFAPSPSGPLHLGSLFCALASYLDAKAHKGIWLVRMEDIDPPREQAGAAEQILQSLLDHGLQWDGEVLFQSTRSQAYRQRLHELAQRQLSYRCNCTRARLKKLTGGYDRHCLDVPPAEDQPSAIRLNTPTAIGTLATHMSPGSALDDFVIHRKDGLFAYQLAVVADDVFQGINCVVRGSDLEPMTEAQTLLFHVFGANPPEYFHLPLVTDKRGNKLSKQNHAPAIDSHRAEQNLLLCCKMLGLLNGIDDQQKLLNSSKQEILAWACAKWQRQKVPSANLCQYDFA